MGRINRMNRRPLRKEENAGWAARENHEIKVETQDNNYKQIYEKFEKDGPSKEQIRIFLGLIECIRCLRKHTTWLSIDSKKYSGMDAWKSAWDAEKEAEYELRKLTTKN